MARDEGQVVEGDDQDLGGDQLDGELGHRGLGHQAVQGRIGPGGDVGVQLQHGVLEVQAPEAFPERRQVAGVEGGEVGAEDGVDGRRPGVDQLLGEDLEQLRAVELDEIVRCLLEAPEGVVRVPRSPDRPDLGADHLLREVDDLEAQSVARLQALLAGGLLGDGDEVGVPGAGLDRPGPGHDVDVRPQLFVSSQLDRPLDAYERQRPAVQPDGIELTRFGVAAGCGVAAVQVAGNVGGGAGLE